MIASALADRLKTNDSAEAALAAKITAGLERLNGQARALSRGLVPVDVDPQGLRAALEDLVARINESGQRARHLSEFSAIVEYLKEEIGEGDVVLTMGAGNVWEIGRDLVG